MDEFPDNSHTAKSSSARPDSEERKTRVEKVGTGRAVVRKKPLGKRILETFFGSDDARGVVNYVVQEVVVPMTKDMAMDAISGGVERAIFGEVRGRGGYSSRPSSGGGHVAYNRYSSGGRPEADRRDLSDRGRRRHDFGEVVFPSKAEADDVLDELLDALRQNGFVTVADFYDAANIRGQFPDEKWGWEDLSSADVRRARGGGYIIVFPRTIPL